MRRTRRPERGPEGGRGRREMRPSRTGALVSCANSSEPSSRPRLPTANGPARSHPTGRRAATSSRRVSWLVSTFRCSSSSPVARDEPDPRRPKFPRRPGPRRMTCRALSASSDVRSVSRLRELPRRYRDRPDVSCVCHVPTVSLLVTVPTYRRSRNEPYEPPLRPSRCYRHSRSIDWKPAPDFPHYTTLSDFFLLNVK